MDYEAFSQISCNYATLLPCENVLDAVSPYKYPKICTRQKIVTLRGLASFPGLLHLQFLIACSTRPGNEAREDKI